MALRLPISSFEHLMLAQDSRTYPCVVYCRMRFSGRLEERIFEESLRAMLRRHPLLHSHVQRTLFGLQWVEDPVECVPIHWVSHDAQGAWVADSHLDLLREPGVKVFVDNLSDPCTVIFQCHHACVDGLGLQNAMDDLWMLYDAGVRGESPELPDRQQTILPSRNRFGLTLMSALAVAPKLKVGLLGVRQYLMRRPVPVVPHQPIPGDQPQRLPAVCEIARFDGEITRQLRRTALQRRATLNELMAASVFMAVAEFRTRRGYRADDEWVRMMVPVNMRTTPQDHRQTACNIVSSVFLDRTPKQISDRDALIDGIHEEMELIKRNRLALIFNASLWIKKRLARGRIPQSPPQRCQTTVVFTNVGKAFPDSPLQDTEQRFRSGGLALEEIIMLAPLTPFLVAAFTLGQYGSDLSLAMRYDPRILDLPSARELMECTVAAAMSWMDSCPIDSGDR